VSPRALLVLLPLAACSVEVGGVAPDAAQPPPGIAPPEVRPEAIPGQDGPNPVEVPDGDTLVVRVDTLPGQHVAFDLRFPSGTAGVLLHVDRWDGETAVPLEVTDGGDGIRVLAVLDQDGPRTFWVRIEADQAITGATLTITRTPFEDGNQCPADCAHLLQLPIPNDPARDGYRIDGATFRYQFGRRDLLMFIRHAGQHVLAKGMVPYKVADISQWDGETPGTDRGAPRHASHQRGKDVDLSLYGSDGTSSFRSYCTTVNNGDGRECVTGTLTGYDGHANALMFSSFYATGRMTYGFLDAELIGATIPGAERGVDDGDIDAALLPLYSDGRHLDHWPNHDNHIHVRVSEAEGAAFAPEPFTAP